MTRPTLLLAFAALAAPLAAQTDDGVHAETGIDRVHDERGFTGRGVIVSVFDRGIDYEHPDFRNVDGTTRIRMIYDLTDNRGASDADNPTGVGTVYTRDEIDAALASGTRLPTRDAVGHGTATAGLIAGNGRASDGRYLGAAPEAEIVVVKFVTEGAAAHDGEPAEAPFYDPSLLPVALDFVHDHAEAAGMPVVHLANFGSSGGPMDGTSDLADVVDARFGPGVPGHVFVSGTSDDGGVANHAGGTVAQGGTAEIAVRKAYAGNLRLDLWYGAGDRFGVEIVAPSGTAYGPYPAPSNGAQTSAAPAGAGFVYYHNGSGADFYGAGSGAREVFIDLSGPAGLYLVRLTGETVADGRFDASLNPSNIYSRPGNVFETFVEPGYTVWDLAAAEQNLAPNSYVLSPTWTDVDGVTRTYPGNDVGTGALWPGSGVGPTYDGRLGVTVSAPGQANIAAYAPRSTFATGRNNLIVDGPAPYGVLGFVSGAAPVVTGIVALLLEADPTLDAVEAREALERSAREDAFTGPTPNPEWGYGKVDAFGAVAEVRPVAAEGGPEGAVLGLEAHPNPLRAGGAVTLTLSRAQAVTVEALDVLGRRVGVLHRGPLAAGVHRLGLDAAGWPAGVVVVRATGEGEATSAVVTVVR